MPEQRLDTDAYYDGGMITQPSEREYQRAQRQAAIERQNAELDEVLVLITQARGAVASAAKDGRNIEVQPLMKTVVISARTLIQEIYNLLYVANIQSLPSDDQMIMENVRKAQMLAKLALDAQEAA